MNYSPGPARKQAPPWSTEELVTLKRLVDEGQSMGAIAKVVGRSRNAVIGRIHRSGFHLGKPVLVRVKREPKPVKLKTIRLRPKTDGRKEPPRIIRNAPEPNALNLELVDIPENGCHWPVNNGGPYLFCGQMKTGKGPYCDHHTARAIAPTPPLFKPKVRKFWR